MMKGLRQIWPDSLSGQLSLALLSSVVGLFLVNIGVVCLIQIKFLGLLEKERATNIASFYMLLSGMEQQQRLEALEHIAGFSQLTESSLSLHLMHDVPEWHAGSQRQAEQSAQAVSTLKEVLHNNNVSPLPEIQARVFNHGDNTAVDTWARLPDVHVSLGNPLLQMGVRLDENTWLNVTQPLYQSVVWLIWMQRLVLLVEFIFFAIIVLFLLKKFLKPFQQLTQAAEHVGKQPEVASPLPEVGCREIREAAQSFNRMQIRIQKNIEERNRMLAAMAHDLRTPLTRVLLRIEEVEPEELRTKLTEGVQEIRSIAEQSLELSSSLQTSEKTVPLDLYAFMQSQVDDFTEMGHNVSMSEPIMSAGYGGTGVVVMARPLCLKRCIDNILRNAIAYAGNAEVSITEVDENVVIDICDSGSGIPAPYLEQIFEPYVRLESSRNRESGGSGLGLSIAKNMILMNNGTLTLANRREGGLRVRIVLPRRKRS